MTRSVALVLASLMLLGCVATTSAAEYTIVIDKLKFGPVPEGLRVGDVIVWRNDDILQHTATADDESFDVTLASKAEERTTLVSAGTFPFYCRYHPSMTGVLVVAP